MTIEQRFAAYLAHPTHQGFSQMLKHLQQVLIDYEANHPLSWSELIKNPLNREYCHAVLKEKLEVATKPKKREAIKEMIRETEPVQ